MRNWDLELAPAIATINGKEVELIYLGYEEEEHHYDSWDTLKVAFDSFSVAEMVLAIGYWHFFGTPLQFDSFMVKNKRIIEGFIEKWFDEDMPELNTQFFIVLFNDTWSNDLEDQMVYLNKERNEIISFREPIYLGYFSIFIKNEYYQDLINDLSIIYSLTD